MVNIISRSELDRIKGSIADREEEVGWTSKRAQLKKLSNDKVKNWPNTLEATRRKKEAFSKERREREELERQEIDREEAELRKQERIKAIQRANDLLYEQRDKMKLLKSQLMFSDVLAEREKQIVDNRIRKELSKNVAKEDHENILKTVKRLEEVEIEQIRKAQESVKEVAKTRQEQLLLVKARKEAEAEENRQIGIAIKLEAQQRLNEEYAAQREKWAMVKQRNVEFKQANDDLKKMKEEMKQREKLAEEERNAQLIVIENRKLALKDLENKRFERAQITKNKLIDKAVENLKKFVNNEESILKKQVEEKEAKDENIRVAKEKKNSDDLRILLEAREEQIRRRNDEMQREREEEERMIKIWRKQYYDDLAEQERKDKKAYDFHKSLKESQYAEGIQRKQQKIDAKMKQLAEDNYLLEKNSHDDDKFVQICKEKLEEYRRARKPTYPIEKILHTKALELIPAKTAHA